jgi:hypothetical protein
MTWTIAEELLKLESADALSTIFTVGNGRSCTRGTLGEERDGFRGVYLSGAYTRAGYGLNYFLCGPDWLPAFLLFDGQVLRAAKSDRVLRMDEGVLERRAEFSGGGWRVALREERLAHLDLPFLMMQRVELEVRSAGTEPLVLTLGLDGDVRNHRAKYFKPGQLPNSDARGLRLSRVRMAEAKPDRLEVHLVSPPTGRQAAALARVTQERGQPLRASPRVSGGLARLDFAIPQQAFAGETFTFHKVCVLAADLAGVEAAGEEAERRFAEVRGVSWNALRK